MTDAQKELCEKLDAPSYTTDDYMVMAEAANEIRYLAGELLAAHNAGAQEPVELHFGHGELVVQAIKVSDFEFPGIAVYRAAQPGEVGASAKREPSVEDPAVLAKSVLLVFPTTEQRNRVEDALVNAQPQSMTDAARDADRLDWIERKHTLHKTVEFLYVVDGYQVQHTHDGCEVGDAFHGETLRDAIDAAMKAEIERIEREGEHETR